MIDRNGPGGLNRKREKDDYSYVVERWRKQDIESSRIVKGGGKRTLEVMFTNGSVYQYYDVHEHIHESLISASSKGTFLNENVKGHFRYARV